MAPSSSSRAAGLFGLVITPLLSLAQSTAAPVSIDTLKLRFSEITINDGLSQGMVATIAQDRQGFMWFGTKDGLNRYDGYNFTVFRHDASDSTSLRESTITSLHCDRYGRLWVGTATGLDLFDERTERFIHVPITHPAGDWGSVLRIALDDHGDLWVSTTNTLLKLTFAQPFTDNNLPPFTTKWFGNAYASLARTRDGTLWGNFDQYTYRIKPAHDGSDRVDTIATISLFNAKARFGGLTMVEDTLRNKLYGVYEHGIAEVDPVTGRITYLVRDPVNLDWLQTLNPVIDRNGMMWMSTFHGLLRFDPVQKQLTLVLAADPDMNSAIQTLKWTTIDRSGILWLGTSGYGLLKYDARNERFNNQSHSSVRALAPMNDGRLLISDYDSYINIYDPVLRRNSDKIRFLGDRWPTIGKQLISQQSDMSAQDRDGVFWSFLNYGTLSRYDPVTDQVEVLRPEIVPGKPDGGYHFPLYFGPNGDLWCGGEEALWRINTRTRACTPYPWTVPVVNNPYPFVTALHQGADGVVWVGTVTGLLRLDPADKTWNSYEHSANDPGSLATPTVFSICADPADPLNVLWIGTNGGGLNRLDTRSGKFTRLTTHEGLANDVVYGVLSDDLGHLWMSTNKGIARFDPRSNTPDVSGQGRFRNFNAGDGLQSDEFNRHAYCKDNKGWLYFGGVSGFNYFDPRSLEQDSTPVEVRFTGIRLINEPVRFGEPGSPLRAPVYLSTGMEIPYSANMVTFSFATMEYAAPELHEYRYMLDGFDAQWIDAGKVNSAVYTNLDPGTYTFLVRGRNRDGIWNERSASFKLTVLPPWWRTWWFYTLCGIVVIGGTLLYIRNLRIQKVVLERTVDQRTRELKHERDRSEELLLNILPEEIAVELKAKGEAEAVHIDQVTVLFTDFKGFTAMSELLTPKELVADIHECFSAFDHIMAKHGIEKIKTIGDAYMAAGGLPTPNTTHALDVVRAALEIRDFIAEGKARKVAAGLPYFEIRIGVHTGPVVAGIVGVKKFAYDIWGDTVNTASRMESSGEVGQVNISEATYALVREQPGSLFHFTPRGKVQAKGKGEMEMYFVRSSPQEA